MSGGFMPSEHSPSVFLAVLHSDGETKVQRDRPHPWVPKLGSSQVQMHPEVCLAPAEQALLPPHPTYPCL